MPHVEYGREPPPHPADPDAPVPTYEELADRLRSLRTALALVSLLAVVALGVGIWALLKDSDDRDRTGASPERVSQLEERTDELERELDGRASDQSVEELRTAQEDLAEQVESISEDTAGEELAQSVEQVREDVAELEQRVEELESQQQDEAAP